MQAEKAPFQIDVDEILRSKAGEKAKRIPRFVVSWLKRRLHQDQVNDFLQKAGDQEGVPWLKAVLDFLDTKVEVKGLENLPSDADGSRFTFVSNHPLGGQDGVALGYVLGTHYEGRIKYQIGRAHV